MKKQYLGDVRDLFKYDLIQQVLKGRSSLQEFTFIPMLTEYDSESRDGDKRDFAKAEKNSRPGTKNKKLMEALKKYKEIVKNQRDFTGIKEYFESEGIKMLLHEDERRKYFDHNRTGDDEYFKNIPENRLHTSLVFVDPDNGLQIKNRTKKHLLFSEAKYLYDHMDKDSILMIYQHYPRARHKYPQYSPEGRSSMLKQELGNLPIYVSDNEIRLFLLTSNEKLKSQLESIITRYKTDYPNLEIGGL